MWRSAVIGLLLAGVVAAQDSDKQLKKRSDEKPKTQQVQEQEPPEEDTSLIPRTYSFNPLEAQKNLQIGNYYFKKGDYKAAMSRFREATLWNPTYAEAFLRLGESEEKIHDKKGAHEAYTKFLSLAPTDKQAASIKKKLASRK